jgi:hypothetical protein
MQGCADTKRYLSDVGVVCALRMKGLPLTALRVRRSQEYRYCVRHALLARVLNRQYLD